MHHLTNALKGNFVVANLGCVGDDDLSIRPELRKTITLIELDAAGSARTHSQYHQKISIQKVIANVSGMKTFRRNTFIGGSSLLRPSEDLIKLYGIERYYTLQEYFDSACITLPQVLKEYNVLNVDLLKTDLEGLDFEIIKSCDDLLGKILAIQSELRFQPFYEGEPYFHEVVAYLHARGYELISLEHTDYWKYKTPHRFFQTYGRMTWTDALFFLSPSKIREYDQPTAALMIAKQIIMACMFQKKNYAEHLLMSSQDLLPTPWIAELRELFYPRFPNIAHLPKRLRKIVKPIELLLRHLLSRSEHVTWK